MLDDLKKPLVLMTESSEPDTAVGQAMRLLQGKDAALTLLDVAEPVPEEAKATIPAHILNKMVSAAREQREARLAASAEAVRSVGITVFTKMLTGSPYRAAIREVLGNNHDLLLKETDSLDSGARATRGATDNHLLRKCPCTVWLTRSGGAEQHANILAAVDPDPDNPEHQTLSTNILRAAADVAALDGALLHVVHAWRVFGEFFLRHPRPLVSDPETDHIVGQTFNRHMAMLDELCDQVPENVTLKRHLVHQAAAQAIVDVVESERIDLLVLGTVGRTGIPGLLIGNTAERVLSEVSCSVLALKPMQFVSPIAPDPASA